MGIFGASKKNSASEEEGLPSKTIERIIELLDGKPGEWYSFRLLQEYLQSVETVVRTNSLKHVPSELVSLANQLEASVQKCLPFLEAASRKPEIQKALTDLGIQTINQRIKVEKLENCSVFYPTTLIERSLKKANGGPSRTGYALYTALLQLQASARSSRQLRLPCGSGWRQTIPTARNPISDRGKPLTQRKFIRNHSRSN
ncbi:hypothetical protein CYMTET_20877 [Cymbomonas tetramitiformis]|uniref:Uncharacterized protein n=1 Tax=Cymbomonas tetramitiformis TaxID=36881 RepID=A0AAE0L3F7_9CHLO|nr:hypothetical protein CYMTET_20877 [Cymbomonas tetramitiformis]